MTIKRWLPTFLGFPLGGWLAFGAIGSVEGPLSAAAGGLLAGTVIGAGQWLVLRSHGIGERWIGYTAAAMGAGAALSAVVTGAGTELVNVMLAGLITGAAVGAAQSRLLARSPAWTVMTAASWSLGWLASAGVIDIDRGFHVFGASGALLVTVLTGVILRGMLAPRGATAVPA